MYILYMFPSDELAHHLRRVRATERARLAAGAREAERHRGVCWSGLAPGSLAPRAEADLAAAARASLAEARDWSTTPQGAFLTAVAAAQKALLDAQACAETARAGAARSLAQERALCERSLGDLRRHSKTLFRSLRAARRALEHRD